MALQITTKGCYGLRAMVDLARHHADCPILLGSVAQRLGVSRKYLHAMLVALKSAGLVRSIRGSGGGYCLTRDPEKITVAEVLAVLEGALTLRDCVRDPEVCERSRHCVTHQLWTELGGTLESLLSAITLRDLIEFDDNPQGRTLIQL